MSITRSARAVSVILAASAVAFATSTATAEPAPYQLQITHEAETDFDVPGRDGAAVAIWDVHALALCAMHSNTWAMFSVEVDLRYTRFLFSDIAADDQDLYGVHVPLSVYRPLGELSGLLLTVSPGLYSDFRDSGSEDYRPVGYVFGFWGLSPRLCLVGGVAYDYELGEETVYPVIGADWHINDAWRLEAILPKPQLRYTPNKRVAAFVFGELAGGEWQVHDRDTDENFDFRLKGLMFGGGLDMTLTEHLHVELSAGASVDREYEFRDETGAEFQSDADDTYFARLTLALR